jgi:branched-subunit amino acid transport protein
MSDQTVLWLAIIATAVGCYAIKLAGLSVPTRVLAHPVAERVAGLIPVALLAALIAVQVLSEGHRLVLDARLAGLAVAVVLLVLRAPFLVVVCGAALAAALLRLL